MYTCSVCRSSGINLSDVQQFPPQTLLSIETAVSDVALCLAETLDDCADDGYVTDTIVGYQLQALEQLAECCAVDLDACIERALEKLRNK